MGMFSSKTVYNVDVVSNPLIDVRDRQDYTKNAVLKGTIGNNGILNSLLDASLGGTATVIDPFYRKYRDGRFIRLPSGDGFYDGGNINEVKEMIESLVKEPVNVVDFYTTGPDANAAAIKYLKDTYNLDVQSKVFDRNPNNEEGVFTYTRAGFTLTNDEFGRPVVNLQEVLIQYTKLVDGVTTEESMVINTEIYWEADGIFLMAYYSLVSDSENDIKVMLRDVKHYLYEDMSIGRFSRLDDYYPIVTIRKNKENTLDTAGTEEIAEINSALKHLGLNLEDLTSQITTSNEDNAVDQMHGVYLLYAADLHTEDKDTDDYMYRYFKSLEGTQATTKSEFDSWLNNPLRNTKPEETVLRITTDGFDASLVFNYIEIKRENRVLADPKNVKKSFTVSAPLTPIGGTISDAAFKTVEMSTVVFEKQINETTVEILTVHGLKHIHEVYKNNIAVRTIESSLDLAANNDNDKSFAIPVSRKILRTMPGLKRHQVLQDTLVIMVYAVQRTKVKWYERGAFKALITLVLIVIAAYTGNWQLPTSFAAAATMAAEALIRYYLITGAIKLVSPILVKIFNELGMEGSLWLIAIITVVSIYFKVDLISITPELALNSVDVMFAIQAEFQEYIMDVMQEIQLEMESWLETLGEFEKELEEIYDLLGMGRGIDYLTITELNRATLEEPAHFINRTLNPNPGLIALDHVTYFVESKLQLPKYSI